jgi:hypothetical protein
MQIKRRQGAILSWFSAWQDVRDADMIRRTKRTAAMKCAIRLEVLLFAMRKIMLFLVLFLPEWGVSFLLHRGARINIETIHILKIC